MRDCQNTPLISRNQLPVHLNSGSHWPGIHSEWDPGIVTISDFMHRQALRDRGSECVLPSPRVTPVIPKGGLSPRLPAPSSPFCSNGSGTSQHKANPPGPEPSPVLLGPLDHVSSSVSMAKLLSPWISQQRVYVHTPKALLGNPQASSWCNSVTCLPEGKDQRNCEWWRWGRQGGNTRKGKTCVLIPNIISLHSESKVCLKPGYTWNHFHQ